MPSIMAEAAAASLTAEAASRLPALVSGQNESSAGTVTRFQTLAKARTVLGGPLDFGDPVIISPIVEILLDMYVGELDVKAGAGRTYVLYAPPSTGKTTGAQYFFKRVLPKLETKGIMISGATRDYHNHMATLLKCDADDGTWPSSLTSAMMPEPNTPLGSYPPLLILDEFNWAGEQDVNILFMDIFMRFVVNKKFICVVQTQNLEVAQKLCALNAGQKVAPLPGLLETPWAVTQAVPWKIVNWEAKLLIKLVRSKFPDKFEAEASVDWVGDGMTPTIVIAEAERRCRASDLSKKSILKELEE